MVQHQKYKKYLMAPNKKHTRRRLGLDGFGTLAEVPGPRVVDSGHTELVLMTILQALHGKLCVDDVRVATPAKYVVYTMPRGNNDLELSTSDFKFKSMQN